MRLTRRVFLEGAGSLAAALALAACGGGDTDAGDEEVVEQEVDVAVIPPEEREFWVCVAGTSHREDFAVNEDTGEESTNESSSSWTATLDDHGNIVSVDGEDVFKMQQNIVLELNEDGLVTHRSGNSLDYDVSYEYDDEGRPVTCSVAVGETDYVLTITYNDLGDIGELVYEDHGLNDGMKWTSRFDEYGVDTFEYGSADDFVERNESGLPTHSVITTRNGARGIATTDCTYEYDDAGNLVHCTRVYTDVVDSVVVEKRSHEIDFEYEQVENPSLAVRLGSHLWGWRSSINDLLPEQAATHATAIFTNWGL